MNEIISLQKNFFFTGQTKKISFRKEQLKKLKLMLINNEKIILKALYEDLHKPAYEAYVSEIYLCIQEINYFLKSVDCLVQKKKILTPITLYPASSYIYPEPYGVILIIAPWNFPLQLLIMPLIGALAAGNCAILKPSEYAPHTAQLLADLIAKTFAKETVAVLQGGVKEAQALLQQPFDYIFFTGSSQVGKLVMKAAAENLIPLTLELGGKNPCIVDNDAHLKDSAKKIIWAKFYNAGQSCIAPDYLFVHASIKDEFIILLKKEIEIMFGKNPQIANNYGRIINQNHFERLNNVLNNKTIITGGLTDKSDLYIAPTLLEATIDSDLMQEEIFGPLLPIISFKNLEDIILYLNNKPKPLALYYFSTSKQQQDYILNNSTSGSICINDAMIQAASPYLPFGGIGMSGFGSYHGKTSFDTFTHYKSVIKGSTHWNNPFRTAKNRWTLFLQKKLLQFLGR